MKLFAAEVLNNSKNRTVDDRASPRRVTSRPEVTSDGDDELGVDVWEAGELCLVEVHDKQFVGRRQLGRLARKLPVKVAHVLDGFLQYHVCIVL